MDLMFIVCKDPRRQLLFVLVTAGPLVHTPVPATWEELGTFLFNRLISLPTHTCGVETATARERSILQVTSPASCSPPLASHSKYPKPVVG